MVCPNCGTQIPDDSLFCPYCGQNIELPKTTAQNNDKNNGQNNSVNKREYCTNRATKMSGGKSNRHAAIASEKMVYIGALLLIVLLMVLFYVFRLSIMFGSFDPNTVDPSAGNGLISYDLEANKYTDKYISDFSVAWGKKDCGYIIKYCDKMETRKNSYSMSTYSTGGVDAHQEVIDIEIYSVKTGETIAKKQFRAELPVKTTSTWLYVDKATIKWWIQDTLYK